MKESVMTAGLGTALGIIALVGFSAHAAPALVAPRGDTKVCAADLDQKTTLISGKVSEVGHDGFGQYMIIADTSTGCRVEIFVDAGEKPCAYGASASIGLKLRKAKSDEVNYFDGGGNEPFMCGK